MNEPIALKSSLLQVLPSLLVLALSSKEMCLASRA